MLSNLSFQECFSSPPQNCSCPRTTGVRKLLQSVALACSSVQFAIVNQYSRGDCFFAEQHFVAWSLASRCRNVLLVRVSTFLLPPSFCGLCQIQISMGCECDVGRYPSRDGASGLAHCSDGLWGAALAGLLICTENTLAKRPLPLDFPAVYSELGQWEHKVFDLELKHRAPCQQLARGRI